MGTVDSTNGNAWISGIRKVSVLMGRVTGGRVWKCVRGKCRLLIRLGPFSRIRYRVNDGPRLSEWKDEMNDFALSSQSEIRTPAVESELPDPDQFHDYCLFDVSS